MNKIKYGLIVIDPEQEGEMLDILHFCTDYVTSRIGKPFWENQDFHNGFVVVGFDQLLHYVQLVLCWYLLF